MKVLKNIDIRNFIPSIEEYKNVIVVFFTEEDTTSVDILNKLKDTKKDNTYLIAIDLIKTPNLGTFFEIKAIPSILVFENGEPTEHIIGKDNINKYINIIKFEKV